MSAAWVCLECVRLGWLRSQQSTTEDATADKGKGLVKANPTTSTVPGALSSSCLRISVLSLAAGAKESPPQTPRSSVGFPSDKNFVCLAPFAATIKSAKILFLFRCPTFSLLCQRLPWSHLCLSLEMEASKQSSKASSEELGYVPYACPSLLATEQLLTFQLRFVASMKLPRKQVSPKWKRCLPYGEPVSSRDHPLLCQVPH